MTFSIRISSDVESLFLCANLDKKNKGECNKNDPGEIAKKEVVVVINYALLLLVVLLWLEL